MVSQIRDEKVDKGGLFKEDLVNVEGHESHRHQAPVPKGGRRIVMCGNHSLESQNDFKNEQVEEHPSLKDNSTREVPNKKCVCFIVCFIDFIVKQITFRFEMLLA